MPNVFNPFTGNFDIVRDVLSDYGEVLFDPTGYENRTDSTISWDDVTRTFTVTTGASFRYFIHGVPTTKTGPTSVVFPDTDGVHYFYIDSAGAMQRAGAFSIALLRDNAWTAFSYWDATNQVTIFKGDERHGYFWPYKVHEQQHLTVGARVQTLATLNTISADDSPPNDASAQHGMDAGVIWDEDIDHSAGAIVSPANLSGFYFIAGGVLRRKIASNFSLIESGAIGDSGAAIYTGAGGRPAYNNVGAGTLVEVTNGSYFLSHFFQTNDANQPFIFFAGTAQYASKTAAEEGYGAELVTLKGLFELPELVYLGSIIWQTSNAYGNTPKARVVSTNAGDDYLSPPEGFSIRVPGATSHSSLSDRDAPNQHPDSSIYPAVALAGALDSSVETNQSLINQRLDDFGYIPDWVTGVLYRTGNAVISNNKVYVCTVAGDGHTSGTFYTDVAAGYWALVGNGGIFGRVQTTDATQTTLMSIATTNDTCGLLSVDVSAFEAATGDCKTVNQKWRLKNDSGVLTVEKFDEAGSEDAGASGWVITVDVSATTARVRVTGEALHTIVWNGTARTTYV